MQRPYSNLQPHPLELYKNSCIVIKLYEFFSKNGDVSDNHCSVIGVLLELTLREM